MTDTNIQELIDWCDNIELDWIDGIYHSCVIRQHQTDYFKNDPHYHMHVINRIKDILVGLKP